MLSATSICKSKFFTKTLDWQKYPVVKCTNLHTNAALSYVHRYSSYVWLTKDLCDHNMNSDVFAGQIIENMKNSTNKNYYTYDSYIMLCCNTY